MKALPVSIGIGAAMGGVKKEFLQALCENDMQVENMMLELDLEKSKKDG